jgi:hypothetical protein
VVAEEKKKKKNNGQFEMYEKLVKAHHKSMFGKIQPQEFV